jgi:hypothetical protein
MLNTQISKTFPGNGNVVLSMMIDSVKYGELKDA